MKIWKDLTDGEIKHNKKHPDKPPIEKYVAFYIDEEKYPEEAKLWNALRYKNLQEIFKESKDK